MKKGMAAIWIIALTTLIVAGVTGGASYYYVKDYSEKTKCDTDAAGISDTTTASTSKNTSTNTTNQSVAKIDTSSWKSLNLKMASGKIKYSSDWNVQLAEEINSSEL